MFKSQPTKKHPKFADYNPYPTKETEKEKNINDRIFCLSSLKKSEKSQNIKENLGSLIFETPPKGSIQPSHYRESSRFFFDRIEVSPTPLKFETMENENNNSVINNFIDECQEFDLIGE